MDTNHRCERSRSLTRASIAPWRMLAFLLTAGHLLAAYAQTTYTWTGAANGAWNNNANWSPSSGYPGTLDNAVIVNATNTTVLDASRTIANLTISSGSLDLATSTLLVTGNGTFSGGSVSNGTLTFNGPSAALIFSGTSFSASLTGSAASIRFNGSSFSGPIDLTRTGAGTDVCTGGNSFGAAVVLTQAGTGTWSLANTGADTYQQGLALGSTGTGTLRMGATSGTSTLSVGTSLSIAPAGFTSGQLILRGLSQLGSAAQNLTFGGTAVLQIDGGTVFNGALTASAPSVILNGGTFQSNATLTKTGSSTDVGAGGCTFNGPVELTNTGAGQWYLHNSIADQFNHDLRLNNSGGGFRLGGTSAGAVLANGRTISVGTGGYSTGVFYLRNFVQLGGTAQTIMCTGTTQLQFLPGTVFNGDLAVTSPRIAFNGGTFHGNCSFTKAGSGTDLSTGGCTFNNTVVFTSAGSSHLYLHNTGTDAFNGNVRLNCTSGAGIRLGAATGTSTLAAGRTIEVGAAGFTTGQLLLRGLAQVGSTAQQLMLGTGAELQFGAASDFSGSVTASSGALYLNGSIFRSTSSFTKTGSTNDACTGGCHFKGDVTFTQAGTGEWRLHDTGIDQFTANILLNGTGTGAIRMGNTSGSGVLNTGGTIAVGSLGCGTGNLVLRGFQQLGSTPQSLLLTGTARLEFATGTVFNGAVQTSASNLFFNGATFNGDLYATKTGGAADASSGGNTFNGTSEFKVTGAGAIWLHATGVDTFNGDVRVDCVGAGGVFLGMSGGSSTLAAGRTVAIGADGFNTGVLSFRNFVQNGSTPQNLSLTGSGTLRFQTGTVFNGDITSSSPGLLLDGGTFNGAADLVRTGSTVNAGTGGCTFNSSCRIRTTGSGGFYMATTADDTFNGPAWFQRLGSGVLSVAYTRDARFRSHLSLTGTTSAVDFGANGGVVRLEGTGDRDYTADPAFPFVVNHFTVNCGIGYKARLFANMTVNGQLAFQSGIIAPMASTSTSAGLLIIPASCTITAAAFNASHVQGFVRKVGNTAFTFPVGDLGAYAPLSITAPSGVNDHFTARYFRADPDPVYSTALKAPTIDHLSRCERWVLDRTGGSSPAAVSLSWDTPRSCVVQLPAELVTARWNGSQWDNEGNGGTSGSAVTGTIWTAAMLNQFGSFTLGSTTSANPLPVELLSFDALAVGNEVVCEWMTASETNSDHFILERTTDEQEQVPIAIVTAAGTSNSVRRYHAVDAHPASGMNYYRLVQVDRNGDRHMSKVVPVRFVATDVFTLTPNPASGDVHVRLDSPQGTTAVEVHDSMGRMIAKVSAGEGALDLVLPMTDQPNGTYMVRAYDDRGLCGMQRLIVAGHW